MHYKLTMTLTFFGSSPPPPPVSTTYPTVTIDRCWISETWKIYTFILPILLIVGVNTFIGIRVVVIMLRAASKNQDNKDDSWRINKVTFLFIAKLVTIVIIVILIVHCIVYSSLTSGYDGRLAHVEEYSVILGLHLLKPVDLCQF
jgi:amino acid permease